MNSFEYIRPATVAEAVAAASTRRGFSRRRHQSPRSHEGRCQQSQPPRRYFPSARARPYRESCRWHVRIGALVRNSDLAYDPEIRAAFPWWPKPCFRVRPHSFATPLRLAAMCCSALAAPTSMTASACNKRARRGCDARGGDNWLHDTWAGASTASHASIRFLRANGSARRRGGD